MNDNQTLTVRQPITVTVSENLSRNLRRAISVINADYQQLDWEDRAFLNRVLTDSLSVFETQGENNADN